MTTKSTDMATKVAQAQLSSYLIDRAKILVPSSYGAVGDGTTDDIDAINNTIAAAPSGGTVLLTAEYAISEPVVNTDGVNIIGLSRTATGLIPLTADFAAITVTGAQRRFVIDNFYIDYGVATSDTAATDADAIGISLVVSGSDYPYYFGLGHLDIWYPYRGIQIGTGPYMYNLDHIYVYTAGNYGIYAGTSGTTARLTNCYTHTCKGGYYLQGISKFVMDACAADYCTTNHVLYIAGGSGTVNGFGTENCNPGADKYLVEIVTSRVKLANYTSTGDTLTVSAGHPGIIVDISTSSRVVVDMPYIATTAYSGTGSVYGISNSAGTFALVNGADITLPAGDGIVTYDINNCSTDNDDGLFAKYGLIMNGEKDTMTGNETFTQADGNVFSKDPGGSSRNLNPSGTFTAYTEVIVINRADDAETITFDSTGLNQGVAQNQRGIFVYDGTAWRKVYVG